MSVTSVMCAFVAFFSACEDVLDGLLRVHTVSGLVDGGQRQHLVEAFVCLRWPILSVEVFLLRIMKWSKSLRMLPVEHWN